MNLISFHLKHLLLRITYSIPKISSGEASNQVSKKPFQESFLSILNSLEDVLSTLFVIIEVLHMHVDFIPYI